MALQGTLDTFELPDVLRLLASTAKTGRLRLESDRGTGDVWLASGQVVGVESAPGLEELGDALFELLRAREGSFAFHPGAEPTSWRAATDVESLLVEAEERLVEWRSIEAVVPSLGAWVALAPELPRPEVTVDAGTWRLVATIAGGLTVAELGDVLGIGEIAVSRLVRDVVELGLGVVTAPPAHAARPPVALVTVADIEPEPAYQPEPAPEPAAADDAWRGAADAPTWDPEPVEAVEPAWEPAFEPEPEHEPEHELVPAAEVELFATAPAPFQPAEVPMPAVAAFDAADPAEAEDVARQLAMLSPRAAHAVAAAASAGSDADRDAALDGVDPDEPINRGLLLKFLSSVKS